MQGSNRVLRRRRNPPSNLTTRRKLRRELELNHILNEQALILHAKYDDQRNDRVRMGQIFGLFLGLGALLVASYLGVHGQPWVAALMGTGGLAGIIWASISGGKRQLEQERAAKAR